jgi:hypothetical protein
VFLSSEPYPFSTKEMNDFQNIFPYSKIVLVDGSYFSWYGSRISKSKEYFEKLISNLV